MKTVEMLLRETLSNSYIQRNDINISICNSVNEFNIHSGMINLSECNSNYLYLNNLIDNDYQLKSSLENIDKEFKVETNLDYIPIEYEMKDIHIEEIKVNKKRY